MLVAKAYAARDGRDFLIPDDVKLAAVPVLRHRLVLTYEAFADGKTADDLITEVMRRVRAPDKPLDSHVQFRSAAQS